LGSPVRHISFSGFDASTLPPHLEAARTYERLGQEFTSASSEPIHLVVHAPANAAAPMQRLAHEVTADHGVRSAGRPRYRGGGIWILDAIPAAPPLSSAAQATVKRLDRLAAPLRPVATGATANFISESDSYGSHLPLALAIVAATTLLLLWALTGSVTLPLTAALLNAATLLAAFGANVWIFEQGHLGSLLGAHNPGPLDESAPILLGALAFGLSTDYGVFLFARIGEERRRGREHVEAIAHGVARTGRVVTSAALLFCVAIGALAISDSRPLKQLGFGTALAVVVDATIVRAVLVPSLMRLIGRWSWWAPARLRRLHTRIRFAERWRERMHSQSPARWLRLRSGTCCRRGRCRRSRSRCTSRSSASGSRCLRSCFRSSGSTCARATSSTGRWRAAGRGSWPRCSRPGWSPAPSSASRWASSGRTSPARSAACSGSASRSRASPSSWRRSSSASTSTAGTGSR